MVSDNETVLEPWEGCIDEARMISVISRVNTFRMIGVVSLAVRRKEVSVKTQLNNPKVKNTIS